MTQKHMTTEEFRLYLETKARRKPKKHRNKAVYVYEDGFSANEKSAAHGKLVDRFDSMKEFDRWNELKMLEKRGDISDLRKQVPLLVYPAFTDKTGKRHRAVIYKADFVYVEAGQETVEDVKAYDKRKKTYLTTAAFNLKWKILQGRYPEKIFRLY